MSNPSKAKGTQEESRIVRKLHEHGFDGAHRAEANRKSWDIVGIELGTASKEFTEWVIEVKKAKSWRLFDWIQNCRIANIKRTKFRDGEFWRFEEKSSKYWVLFCSHGEQRTKPGKDVGNVAIVDQEVFMEMLKIFHQAHAKGD